MSMKINRISTTCMIACLGATVAMAQDMVVKIGHAAAISGAQASYGKDNENGARLAIDDLNAAGVVIGGKRVKLELMAEDDAAEPKQGTAVAQKLCDAKVSGVVGHMNSGTTIPAAKIYNECGIPHITPSASNPDLTKPGYKTTFRLLANDNALGAGLAVYAADVLHLKRIAVIDDRSAYGQGIVEVFKKTASSKGIAIVDQSYTTDKAADFMAILTAIRAKKPEGVFFGGMDSQAGPMLRQMEQLGLTNVKYFGGDGICSLNLIKQAAGAKTLDNVICAEGGASLDKMPGGKAWRARYDAKYPGEFQVYSPYVYDAVHVLVDAMRRANSSDPKVYLPKLADANYQGVTTKVQFESNGELKNPSMTLYTYKENKKIALN
ncbi:MAG: branched-chain amino acid ABC transporter substrate-binding protein [Rhodoferax sp.]|uniref:branched-chain amino acid ABC transporter substrate-binding protein n=1 Tax=Rhodoferax sp. TaxID=50421 RepID=UPI00261F2CED|nr:branched-chain amino acid ABC transporter substrate-binding protein [Rhodoferax sp.]MDD5336277.1 branched-chain amino acid ABC transporter substrate-binding protein [Rhodoferax sp.]